MTDHGPDRPHQGKWDDQLPPLRLPLNCPPYHPSSRSLEQVFLEVVPSPLLRRLPNWRQTEEALVGSQYALAIHVLVQLVQSL